MSPLISADQIQKRIAELGAQIQSERAGRPLTVVGVLTGSLLFLADLIRHLDGPVRIGFLQASSYRGASIQAGSLLMRSDLLPNIEGHHVLLLDDILDTGQTLVRVVECLNSKKPASLRVGVLLRKDRARKHNVHVDYVGFDIPDKFVVGYGLDFNDEYRNLPYIAELTGPV